MIRIARTAEQIEADGANPRSAAQQAQLESWLASHDGKSVTEAIAADEIDAYAADGFMTASRPVAIRECGKELAYWPFGSCTERAGHAGDCDRRSTKPRRRAASPPAYTTRIGTGLYLTPSDAAMPREHMAVWLRARGVRDAGYLDELLTQYAGKTENEMDQIYDEMHS